MEPYHHRIEKLKKKGVMENMVKLSWWEEMVIGSAISFLVLLETKVKNPAELAALKAAVAFLQKLLSGNVTLEA